MYPFQSQEPENSAFDGKTFLIVDDFNGMRSILRDMLRGCGANMKLIDTANSGVEAISLLENKKYDVVLCDYNLGQGKNGQQVLEEARHRQLIGPACAWLMVTAEKTNDVVMGTSEYLPDAFILKPVTEATFRLRLTKIWAKKAAFSEISERIDRDDYPGAIALCDQRLTFDKANEVELLKLKAQLLLKCGKHDEARSVFEQVSAERDLPWAKVGLAKLRVQEGDLGGAKSLLEEAVANNRSYLEAYDSLAQVYQALAMDEQAEQVLEQAARLSPNSVLRQKELGDISLKLGKLERAEKAFKKSMNLGEHSVLKSPDSYLGLAKTCSAQNNPGEALRVLETLNKNFDDEAVRIKSLTAEGMVHHKSGQVAAAREVAQKLSRQLAHASQNVGSATTLEMAQLLFATGEKDAAVNLLKQEVKNNPENTRLLDQVKQVFTGAKMGEQGDELVESSRKAAIEQMNRGVLLVSEGKIEEAITWMREAREAMPSNARVLFNLAHVLITRLQKMGGDQAIAAEAHEALAEANRLAPGEKRFAQLMAALDAALHR
ncbi:MAG: tetratricopeptide repeat protein [Nitrosomonadales bacterium]|nr:tetratricopeptide repeat protein [Nitrosomonadales bacterium]